LNFISFESRRWLFFEVGENWIRISGGLSIVELTNAENFQRLFRNFEVDGHLKPGMENLPDKGIHRDNTITVSALGSFRLVGLFT